MSQLRTLVQKVHTFIESVCLYTHVFIYIRTLRVRVLEHKYTRLCVQVETTVIVSVVLKIETTVLVSVVVTSRSQNVYA